MKKRLVSTDETLTGVLWGLVASVKEYQLCWHINKILGFGLKRGEDIEIIYKKKNKTAAFSYFRYENEIDKSQVFLVSNKHLGEFLIPEVKQVDYFLMIKGEVSDTQKNELQLKLKAIPVVQLVKILDYASLKSKDNLILE